LCWWANVNFGAANIELLADAGFTLKNATLGNRVLPGLGLNIARYNAGASSYRVIENGTSMVSSPNIPHWKQLGALWRIGRARIRARLRGTGYATNIRTEGLATAELCRC
jgi:galactan endo-1,6-beta-galactosidase